MHSTADFLTELDVLTRKFDAKEPLLELTIEDNDMDIRGYVVVWNTRICKGGPLFTNGKGCGKGGTRIAQELTISDVKRLARAMAQKNAAAGLPLGGAKSGLDADPNAPDYEAKWKRFVRLVKDKGILYEDGGIFGGFGYDIGGRPPLNALWTIEELGNGRSFTGKPLEHGGTDYDRIGIAGYGVAVAGRAAIDIKAPLIKAPKFAVQGVGAMGHAVCKYFNEFGGELAYISDLKFGGTWSFENNDAADFIATPDMKTLERCATKISDDLDGALFQNVDIVFPCALEDTLTKVNATNIQARFYVEGANNPTTDEAHNILFENGITVVPDIIANPGGIIAAFVEMTSEQEDKAQEALDVTKDKITNNVQTLLNLQDQVKASSDLVADYLSYKKMFNT